MLNNHSLSHSSSDDVCRIQTNETESSREAAPPASASVPDLRMFLETWNQVVVHPDAKLSGIWSSSAEYHLLSDLVNTYGMEDVLETVHEAGNSDYLRGAGYPGMRLSWFVKPENYIKVRSGYYKNRRSGKTAGSSGSCISRNIDLDQIVLDRIRARKPDDSETRKYEDIPF